MPSYAHAVQDDYTLISTSQQPHFGHASGTVAVFDPTNQTLTLPHILRPRGLSQPPSTTVPITLTDEPTYPSPFRWSGTMAALVTLNTSMEYPPYHLNIFGMQDPHNAQPSKQLFPSVTTGRIEAKAYLTHLRVNFTAGVIWPATSTYMAATVIEADHNDPQGGDIEAAPWVREALYMMSDVMNCMVTFNSTAIPTWHVSISVPYLGRMDWRTPR
jgi:hypothetical protein